MTHKPQKRKVQMMEDCNVFEAIAEGVDRAMTRMITGITQMPSSDFWDTLKTAIETAFERVANETIDHKLDERK